MVASSANAAPPLHRKKRNILWLIGGIFLLLLGVFFFQRFGPNPPLQLTGDARDGQECWLHGVATTLRPVPAVHESEVSHTDQLVDGGAKARPAAVSRAGSGRQHATRVASAVANTIVASLRDQANKRA